MISLPLIGNGMLVIDHVILPTYIHIYNIEKVVVMNDIPMKPLSCVLENTLNPCRNFRVRFSK